LIDNLSFKLPPGGIVGIIGAKAALTHDQFIGWLAVFFAEWANHDWLQNTEFSNRVN
jgi:hypothetical protein